MVNFLKKLTDEIYDERLLKNLEYSAHLILQILNKVILEHRYPFSSFMI